MAVSRTAIIAGNWKMNYGPRQASSFAAEILPALQRLEQARKDGFWLAGYISYEAGHIFEEKLRHFVRVAAHEPMPDGLKEKLAGLRTVD